MTFNKIGMISSLTTPILGNICTHVCVVISKNILEKTIMKRFFLGKSKLAMVSITKVTYREKDL